MPGIHEAKAVARNAAEHVCKGRQLAYVGGSRSVVRSIQLCRKGVSVSVFSFFLFQKLA